MMMTIGSCCYFTALLTYFEATSVLCRTHIVIVVYYTIYHTTQNPNNQQPVKTRTRAQALRIGGFNHVKAKHIHTYSMRNVMPANIILCVHTAQKSAARRYMINGVHTHTDTILSQHSEKTTCNTCTLYSIPKSSSTTIPH